MIKEKDEMVLEDLKNAITYKVVKNRNKDDWDSMSLDALKKRFYEEIDEFFEAVEHETPDRALLEIADVAIFGAFIAHWKTYHKKVMQDGLIE